MRILVAALCAAFSVQADTPLTRQQLLSRVAEESAVFEQNIPKTLTQETLDQRALFNAPSRFKPRLAQDAVLSSKRQYRLRQVVSEYTVGTFKESRSHDLHEFRQVTSVDGRNVQSTESASQALSQGLKSPDDRLRKRMLEDFARYGVVDIAVDYSLILLLFSPHGIGNLQVESGEQATIGVDPVLALHWKQKSEAGGQIEFSGRRIIRQPLEGVLWVRTDGLPLRIEAWAEYADNKHIVRDQGTVDYTMSAHGFLTPASVVHRHIVDGQLITENVYRYDPFRMFGSDAEIKFTGIPEMPPAVKKP